LQKRTRSILNELDSFVVVKDKAHFIESKASNLIQGAINLLQYIRENYDSATADEMERRLINSIRSQDSNKFSRGIKKLKEDGKDET
jgi:hypothetical protein